MNINIYRYPKEIWNYFSKKRKKQIWCAIFFMIFSSLADLVSIASVFPFLYVITSKPETLWENDFFREFFKLFWINDPNKIFIPITIIFIFTAIVSGVFKTTYLWFNSRLSGAIGSDLSTNVYNRVLNQPYPFHINKNSNKVVSALTQHLSKNIRAIQAYLDFFGSTITNIVLIYGLLVINWKVALGSLLIFGLAYWIILKFARSRLLINSKKIAQSYDYQVKIINEGIGAIRELILYQLQSIYLNKYKDNDYPMRKWESEQTFLTNFSKYLLETLALLLIAFITISLFVLINDPSKIVPTLGTITLCIQRLLPGLQKSYVCFAFIKSVWGSIEDVYNLLQLPLNNKVNNNKQLKINNKEEIVLKDISFKYPSSKEFIFKKLNLKIRLGTTLGIIGKTGEGKSTFIDILMGLLEPNSGEIFIGKNNLKIPENLHYWRNCISHVPQDIYLADISIAKNIALCLDEKKIDLMRLKSAAKIACIDSFIESTKNGYKTLVGERGILLSGGQKQRIGIARAIYKSSRVLILDEATSSLDKSTEIKVINAIREANMNFTLIMIAHNTKTLEKCDRIIKFKNGNLSFDGLYEEIV